ncbi:UNKNOWN [Stylonychia lemnae]|uniref:Uncharacterized protein n=1 Tax=Stylonychia lemnae TaxID=5949 RepID=A0A078AJ82_STYLE|nr:UNKNOWN [Stylonychia lemnae]|eukprot:CDW81542.1 UNKNOWN [Stylonychia lemnae]
MMKSIKMFEDSSKRLLKPLPNKEFQDMIQQHSKILQKQNYNSEYKRQNNIFKSRDSSPLKLKRMEDSEITMNDLSKDFMQIVNLGKQEEEKNSKFLLCEVDPKSILYEPIESLRKLLLQESDNDDSSLTDSFEEHSVSFGDRRQSLASQAKKSESKKQTKERTQLELYMDSVESELRKKYEDKGFGMNIIKELQEFYQNCFTQFIYNLSQTNQEYKKIANRISNGVELTFSAFLRHHVKEVQCLNQVIEEQKRELSDVKNSYNFLRNDIQNLKSLAPQVQELIEKHLNQTQSGYFTSNQETFEEAVNNTRSMSQNEREKYFQKIIENEEQLHAITQIEEMINLRNQHILKKKQVNDGISLDRFKPSDAESNLKSIINEIKVFQDQQYLEQRMTQVIEKDDQDMNQDIEKQKRIINKDWTGERNVKIMEVKMKLVDKMARRLNKPIPKSVKIQTEEDYITKEEYQRVQQLNISFHKQLAVNGQLFSQKEKQVGELTRLLLISEQNFKRCDRQLNDLKILNNVKKNFMSQIKSEYEDIVLSIVNICVKYAKDIRGSNEAIIAEIEVNQTIQEILEIQKKCTEDYLYALLESRRVMNEISQTQQLGRAKGIIKNTIQSNKKTSYQGKSNLNSSSNNQKKDILVSDDNSDSDESTDSVDQVINAKINYTQSNIYDFETANLRQRYSIGQQILKNHIFKINQTLEEEDLKRSSSMALIRQGQENAKQQRIINRLSPITQELQSLNLQNLRDASSSKEDNKISILEKYRLQNDEFAKKISVEKEKLNSILQKPLNFTKFVQGEYGQLNLQSNEQQQQIGVISDQQSINFTPTLSQKMDQLLLTQNTQQQRKSSFQKSGSKQNFSHQNQNSDQENQGLSDELLQQMKEMNITLPDLTEIKEVSEGKTEFNTRIGTAKTKNSKQDMEAEHQQRVQEIMARWANMKHKNIQVQVAELKSSGTQTEYYVDDYGMRLNNSLSYINKISDNFLEFKTEMQNHSAANKMISEQKIDQMRQFLRFVLNKSLTEPIQSKNHGTQQNAVLNVMSQHFSNKILKNFLVNSQQTGQNQPITLPQQIEQIIQPTQNPQSQSRPGTQGAGARPLSKEKNLPMQIQQLQSQRDDQNERVQSREKILNRQQSKLQINDIKQNQDFINIAGKPMNDSFIGGLNLSSNVMKHLNLLNPTNNSSSLLFDQSQYIHNPTSNQLIMQKLHQIPKIHQQQAIISQIASASNGGLTNSLGLKGLKNQQNMPLRSQTNKSMLMSKSLANLDMLQSLQSQESFRQQNETQLAQNQIKDFNNKQIIQSQLYDGNDQQQISITDQNNLRNSMISDQSQLERKYIQDQMSIINQYNNEDENQEEFEKEFTRQFGTSELLSRAQSQLKYKPLEPVQHEFLARVNHKAKDQDNLMLKHPGSGHVTFSPRKTQSKFQMAEADELLDRFNLMYSHQIPLKYADQDESIQQQDQSTQKAEPILMTKLTPGQQKYIKKLIASQHLTVEQKFYYLRMIQIQLQNLNYIPSHPIGDLIFGKDARLRKRRSRKQPVLEPLKITKLKNREQTMKQSYSHEQLPRVQQRISTRNKNVFAQTQSDYQLDPSITDYQIYQLDELDNERQEQTMMLKKELIKSHADSKSHRELRQILTYRDRKRSIQDMERQGHSYVETQSYSKEGKRLDHLPLNL